MNKNILKNTTLVLFSTILAFVLGEIAVRVMIPQNKQVTWIEMHDDGFMMNRAGGKAYHEIGQRNVEYSFTNTRLRGKEPQQRPYKILTLGDSFTFGLFLGDHSTYVHHLQTLADSTFTDSVQFMNAAVGGTGLADWPGWLARFGQELAPDMVILFLNTEDLDRALSKNLFVYDAEHDSLIPSRRWKPRAFFRNIGQNGMYQWLQRHSELMNIIVKLLWRFVYFEDVTHHFDPQKTKVPIPTLEEFDLSSGYSLQLGIKLIESMNAWCAEQNCEFKVATTGFFNPENPPNQTTGLYHYLHTNYKPELEDITSCVGETINWNFDSITIPGDSHPNEAGAQIIATCTWQWLKPALSRSFSLVP